ncbi:uncharacterized protein L969DRAFT_52184 [Mixia osmundae IAM 14324]|uniref:Major facilitator superfamily (MFS) profile domain-containing protein n=1 Tax=Mixia osmundae (strain CBS 9802 / IAM 14324 / JCM 22182 / KY 12970) TaxID=764103 RepID=G7DWX9_MIXOS|nr:uncharacterized protein L969DRAFT_52184 [Mixia osmundae IAM 14324]KEI38114.1 hypothetical protein L969DRAFT_52184 [Mixia osmundae IAM 14324]GAA95076.1 hypothetical protein E5Q_01731 [Mixia osmundae IAM 14324]
MQTFNNLEEACSPPMRQHRLSDLTNATKVDDASIKELHQTESSASVARVSENAPFESPTSWSFSKKLRVNTILCFATLALTYSSSAYASSVTDIVLHFRVSRVVAILGVSLFVLGFAIGPLLLAPASNVLGRKPIYVMSYLAFFAFMIGAAVSPNMASLAICRFFAGMSGCTSLTIAPASLSEFTRPQERFKFMIWFAVAAFGGPSLGPLFGDFISYHTRPIPGSSAFANKGPTAQWRINLWIQAIVVGLAMLMLIFGAPETSPLILQERANAERAKSLGHMTDHVSFKSKAVKLRKDLTHALVMPIIFAFTEPLVIFCSLFLSLLYGIIYGLFAGLPYVFQVQRGWTQQDAGLVYISLAIGFLIGAFILRVFGEMSFDREFKRLGHMPPPESRLVVMSWLVIFTPCGLFIFGFTSYHNLHWFGMLVGLALFSMSTICVFACLLPYLALAYQSNAVDAFAVTAVTRAGFAAGFPLFSYQLFEKLTPARACGLLGGLSLLLTPLPWILIRKGPAMRHKSKYAIG